MFSRTPKQIESSSFRRGITRGTQSFAPSCSIAFPSSRHQEVLCQDHCRKSVRRWSFHFSASYNKKDLRLGFLLGVKARTQSTTVERLDTFYRFLTLNP